MTSISLDEVSRSNFYHFLHSLILHSDRGSQYTSEDFKEEEKIKIP
ncbi:hypothetical protein RHABOEDO_001774 [Candidatus Rhabdochlamydia oedothoracis]|uniref:Integrase catalytic domain-containing protein n=1 Tax=Candidatus Rhabdochlamydia oedothoracis TaxID=2720720 RepID=A0ABX8V8R9_9BACT|nr:hypothetical protein RHOW815_001384 [Candidatus Rhabdochlamydia sp. W815]QYF49433.1 hypothetical protein RHABOEDO_001774 [Candidatus Rhabdochlamydia oedothoracis]